LFGRKLRKEKKITNNEQREEHGKSRSTKNTKRTSNDRKYGKDKGQ
jgi:hypothetical protein